MYFVCSLYVVFKTTYKLHMAICTLYVVLKTTYKLHTKYIQTTYKVHINFRFFWWIFSHFLHIFAMFCTNLWCFWKSTWTKSSKCGQNFWWGELRKQNLMTKTVDKNFWWGELRTQNLMTKTVAKTFLGWMIVRKQNLLNKTVGKIFWWGEFRKQSLMTKTVDKSFGEESWGHKI